MGYLLIGVGVILVALGVMVVMKPKKVMQEVVQRATEPAASTVEASANTSTPVIESLSETNEQDPNNESTASHQDESYAKGLAFEEFIVKRFDTNFFTVKEWRGDKQVDGVYAQSNTYPDLVINFNYRKEKVSVDFAVECKWRQSFFKNEIEWSSKQQIERYNQFSREKNIPVFVAMGIGGEPDAPEQMYIVPLDKLQNPSVSFDELKLYRRQDPNRNLFWDTKEGVLK